MKSFFQQYSYSMIKMFVNQFVISMFGIMVAMATAAANNTVLTWVGSIFSIVFYLFLIYTMTWEIGATDRISVDVGKKPYRPHTGLLLSLFANLPNFVIALLYTLAYPFMGTHKWAGNLNAVLHLISSVVEGMYRGVLSLITIPAAGAPMFQFWWAYFVIIVPSLVTAWIAYFAGFKNFRIVAQYFNKNPNQGAKK